MNRTTLKSDKKVVLGRKAQGMGINHVALEVGDVEEALDFYGKIVTFEIRGQHKGMVFIDLGDQFIALSESPAQQSDAHRHFGLVVDDKYAVGRRLAELDVDLIPGYGLNFRDPWGNRVQIVEYGDIQFTKAPHVLRGMGLSRLKKKEEALKELEDKGMAP